MQLDMVLTTCPFCGTGCSFYVIDPRSIPLTEYADLFIQVKPGTNVALINGMIHILIEKGLIDEAFIQDRTEGFQELKVLAWPCPDEHDSGTPFLHKEGFPRGKGKFFALDYVPPPELPDTEYPFMLSTGRIPFHFHGGSMTRRIDTLNREAPTGYMKIHPEDAARLGMEEGDTVEVRSRRGKISIQVERSIEMAPGMVFIPMHFAECPVNTLTDRVFDPVAKIPGFKVCAVAIEN